MGFPAEQRYEYEDSAQRHALITKYVPYVKQYVSRSTRHMPNELDMEDLISAGMVGLLEAIDNYDPSYDTKFLSYATFRIRGGVLNEIRSHDIHSRAYRKKVRALQKSHAKLQQRLGREVFDDELASEMALSVDEFFKIKQLASISCLSLDDFVSAGTDEDDTRLSDQLVDSEHRDILDLVGSTELRAAVEAAVRQLPEKERLVMVLYYWEELLLSEIAELMGVSESRVCQIRAQGTKKITRILQQQGISADWNDSR